MSERAYQQLLAYVVDPNADAGALVSDWVRGIISRKSWLTGRGPVFVNEVSDPGDSDRGDLPIVTVGFLMEILPPQAGLSARELEQRTYNDVAFMVQEAAAFSARTSLAFEFELDGTYVGGIDNGVLNRSLREGLLGEWARHLNGPAPTN